MAACFILKEKILCFDDLQIISVWDIMKWTSFKLFKELDNEGITQILLIRHLKRQQDINRALRRENPYLSK
jgi:hypothetical protein